MFEKIFEFESELAKFTGAPYAIMTDCCTHAIELCLRYDQVKSTKFTAYTYLSMLMTMAQLDIKYELIDEAWIGEYQLYGTRIWDSARRLEPNMYRPGTFQCVSFSRNKPLKAVRGGAILLDDAQAYDTMLKQRCDGRDLNTIDWGTQTHYQLGYHYMPKIEEAELSLECLKKYIENKNFNPEFYGYPDCRNITISK